MNMAISTPATRALLKLFLAIGSIAALSALFAMSASAQTVSGSSNDVSCARTSGGEVKCWGRNAFGLNGVDPATAPTYYTTTPTTIGGMGGSVTSFSSYGWSACALITGGSVKCWGYNRDGQLGDGTTTNTHTAVSVVGLGGAASQVSMGGSFACALTSGRVRCWGNNEYGQLGDGTTVSRPTPTLVPGLTNVTQISANSFSACAKLSSGAAKCWGYNGAGQLGDGTNNTSYTPVRVSGLTKVKTLLAANESACAILTTGAMKCWGANYQGQLGTGDLVYHSSPVPVVGLGTTVVNGSMATGHTCAVTSQGQIKCWGRNNYGQLGDGTLNHSYVPVTVAGLPAKATRVGNGYDHTCARLSTNKIFCWGTNYVGQLGNGTTNSSLVPVPTLPL